MLNIEEINEEINKLENSDCTSYSVCQKLAFLYIVRDHYKLTMSNQKKDNNTTMKEMEIPAMK